MQGGSHIQELSMAEVVDACDAEAPIDGGVKDGAMPDEDTQQVVVEIALFALGFASAAGTIAPRPDPAGQIAFSGGGWSVGSPVAHLGRKVRGNDARAQEPEALRFTIKREFSPSGSS